MPGFSYAGHGWRKPSILELLPNSLKWSSPHLGEMLAYGAYGPGPSGTLPTDASLQDRLLDWFGRRP
jgi:hypothetical protein